MIDKISFSMIDTFFNCKLRFKYLYVDRRQPDTIVKHISAYFGTIIHATFARFYNGLDFSFPALKIIFFDEFMNTIKKNNLNYLEIKFDALIARGYKMLERFYEVQSNDKQLRKAEMIEKYFKIPTKLGINISGVIDMVVDEVIIDYKTDSKPDHKKALTTLQLPMYSVAYRKLTGKKEKGICLFFLEDGKKIYAPTTPESYKNLSSAISEIYNFVKVSKDDDYIKNTKNCFFCEYKQTCKGHEKNSALSLTKKQ